MFFQERCNCSADQGRRHGRDAVQGAMPLLLLQPHSFAVLVPVHSTAAHAIFFVGRGCVCCFVGGVNTTGSYSARVDVLIWSRIDVMLTRGRRRPTAGNRRANGVFHGRNRGGRESPTFQRPCVVEQLNGGSLGGRHWAHLSGNRQAESRWRAGRERFWEARPVVRHRRNTERGADKRSRKGQAHGQCDAIQRQGGKRVRGGRDRWSHWASRLLHGRAGVSGRDWGCSQCPTWNSQCGGS
jgi:hypothetical protein